MVIIDFKPSEEKTKWVRFGTTNNPAYARELLQACLMHHPGCPCRIQDKPAPVLVFPRSTGAAFLSPARSAKVSLP